MENGDTDEEDGGSGNVERNDINLVNLENRKSDDNATKDSDAIEDIGLFRYTPKCFQHTFLNVYGLLFFLCWASTIQVSNRLSRYNLFNKDTILRPKSAPHSHAFCFYFNF